MLKILCFCLIQCATIYSLPNNDETACVGLLGRNSDALSQIPLEIPTDNRVVKRGVGYSKRQEPAACQSPKNTVLPDELKHGFSFNSPFVEGSKHEGTQSNESTPCIWQFLGDKKCVPEIKCKGITLPESEDCEDAYLEISDGIGGLERFCGETSLSKVKASKGGRDLFVKLQFGDSKSSSTISCRARCSKKPRKARFLKKISNIRKETQCVCGLQNHDDRIVGGVDARYKEFPWLAALVNPGTREPFCSGTVINNRYILTAAHCFVEAHRTAKDVEIVVHARLMSAVHYLNANPEAEFGEEGWIKAPGWNETELKDEDEGSQRFKVAEVINHPRFSYYDYDVTLVKLDKAIDLTDSKAPTPICLPRTYGPSRKYLGKQSTVVGWGMGHEIAGSLTRSLQKLAVPVMELKTCKGWFPKHLAVTQRMICAGFEEGVKDACQGDSGGPLLYQNPNKQWEQIGIVSWGQGCAREKKPGMYSRITELSQWIQYNSEGATWCRYEH